MYKWNFWNNQKNWWRIDRISTAMPLKLQFIFEIPNNLEVITGKKFFNTPVQHLNSC